MINAQYVSAIIWLLSAVVLLWFARQNRRISKTYIARIQELHFRESEALRLMTEHDVPVQVMVELHKRWFKT